MQNIKKLIFAPFFLIVFGILIFQLNPLLKSYDFIFSLSWESIIQLFVLTGVILLSSLFFVIFASLAYDWKIVLPVAFLASLIPIPVIGPALGLILSVGVLVSFLLAYLGIENTLKSYLNFEPASLFGPPIRHLSSLLILVIALTYFLSISSVLQKESFQIPDSLIDQALKLTPLPKETSQPEQQTIQPQITQEQIELLKQNPNLLKQYGLDPSILDSLGQPKQTQSTKAPQNLLTDTLKQTLKDQLQNIIKPYLGIIPAVLAVLLFFILLSISSILNLLIYPLLWISFYIFEKSGFIKFTEEQRPVKKIVI